MHKTSDIVSHPNFLTLFRIGAAPILILLMLSTSKFATFLAAIVFSIASITDYLDGYLARRRGLVSHFGKVMDPVADKLLISSAIIMLVSNGWVSGWIGSVIIGRELAITGLRNLVIKKGGDISASNLGKYKTGFQIAAIIPLIFHYSYFGVNLELIGNFFLWGALIFTIWSGIDYLMKFKDLSPFTFEQKTFSEEKK